MRSRAKPKQSVASSGSTFFVDVGLVVLVVIEISEAELPSTPAPTEHTLPLVAPAPPVAGPVPWAPRAPPGFEEEGRVQRVNAAVPHPLAEPAPSAIPRGQLQDDQAPTMLGRLGAWPLDAQLFAGFTDE